MNDISPYDTYNYLNTERDGWPDHAVPLVNLVADIVDVLTALPFAAFATDNAADAHFMAQCKVADLCHRASSDTEDIYDWAVEFMEARQNEAEGLPPAAYCVKIRESIEELLELFAGVDPSDAP